MKDNQIVRKGQLPFQIDPESYEIAVEQAEARLASARLQEQRPPARTGRTCAGGQPQAPATRLRRLLPGPYPVRLSARRRPAAAGRARPGDL
ncbi:biotin/lipoyl-binding protein [Phenylobacterium montanum]|uniref:Biotin/lipoyl-binding protein n=1 Tax=Phenylobacterium montanum TaxID=2823693 RepID=A0A975ISR1_9CAUL|nr:biotin/lipoyl-binding protein [Caulobacter sp. S6]